MATCSYVPRKFSAESRAIIDQANKIIAEYQEQEFTLTLRQLYYQFVARDLLPNSLRSYGRLGVILNKARLAGEVDWLAIEDRTRNLRSLATWDTPADILAACASQFRFDLWETQPARIEVWIEKDALVGVIERVCEENRVPYFACRGYTSQSEQWRAGERFRRYIQAGQRVVVLHLGDHDPSGIDMTRDNEDRLRMFIAGPDDNVDADLFEVRRLALNMDQVTRYRPPPNPAKLTDSRIAGYARKFGRQSWELDALDPPVIAALIEAAIDGERDGGRWGEALTSELKAKNRLEELADNWEM